MEARSRGRDRLRWWRKVSGAQSTTSGVTRRCCAARSGWMRFVLGKSLSLGRLPGGNQRAHASWCRLGDWGGRRGSRPPRARGRNFSPCAPARRENLAADREGPPPAYTRHFLLRRAIRRRSLHGNSTDRAAPSLAAAPIALRSSVRRSFPRGAIRSKRVRLTTRNGPSH